MSQDDYIAKQERAISSVTSLLTGLRKLSLLHIDINQESISKWQEDNITPIQKDILKAPTLDDWREYLADIPQRITLFWDTLRQRGDNTLTYQAEDRSLWATFYFYLYLIIIQYSQWFNRIYYRSNLISNPTIFYWYGIGGRVTCCFNISR